MTVIADSAALAAFCQHQAAADFLAIDTEFLRDTTYWPKLCLVQVGAAEDAVAIDTLAEGMDLAPLGELLANPKVLKVFHSARQDLEIFFHLFGQLPAPIFDTQVAAMVCGFGESVSYDRLVSQIVGARLDKVSRFADWSHRPLTPRQLDYALADVIHLRPIYARLSRQLKKSGRAAWLSEEMAVLTTPATYALEPQEAWRRLKSRSNDRRFLAVLKALAAWREVEAQRRDVPRNRILRDEQLLDVAAHTPADAKALARTRGLSRDFAEGRMGRGILDAIKAGQAIPAEQRPNSPPRHERISGLGPVVDLLKVLLKAKCESHGVAQKLVASVADLELIAADDEAEVPALSGWRREIFGADALRLKHGELALTIRDREVRLAEPGQKAT
ncbi:MAG: ribonuclease D [Kiloniellales bacterium]|nr:ribonuclease D [Kiloniellales bacterium]